MDCSKSKYADIDSPAGGKVVGRQVKQLRDKLRCRRSHVQPSQCVPLFANSANKHTQKTTEHGQTAPNVTSPTASQWIRSSVTQFYFPEERYVQWTSIGGMTYVDNAIKLGWKKKTWNLPGSFTALESLSYESLPTTKQTFANN